MASTAHTASNLLECDYLHSHTSPIPQAELTRINEQISSLDYHISQLKSLRRALHHRSRQLHNLLSPIRSLPFEILSRIFQEAAHQEAYKYEEIEEYRRGLHQAFVLSFVSAHFRYVAFSTPELWRRIPIKATVGKTIGQLSSLLRHCMTFAPNLDVLVDDRFDEFDEDGDEEACSDIETLFTSEVTRRIKIFKLNSLDGLNVWKTKLKGSSFPILDYLGIFDPYLSLDLRTLSTVSRLEIHQPYSYSLIILPPSVRYLFLHAVPLRAFISILSQCPNLEECRAYDSRNYYGDQAAQLYQPLTLTHLKRLTLKCTEVITRPSSVQNLQLPSLEYLNYKIWDSSDFIGFSLLCCNVSATLTTLKIVVARGIVEYDTLYQLCGLPFPNLRKLGFGFHYSSESMPNVVCALTRRAEECSKAELHFLPSLATLTLCYDDDTLDPRCFLGLLKTWRVGETSLFHLKFEGFISPALGDGSLEEELRSIVGDRQIKVSFP